MDKKIDSLVKDYLALIEISENDAIKNAEYIYKYLVVKDEMDDMLMKDTMKPVVKVVEYIENPEKTQAFVDYHEKHGKDPDWAATDTDWGLKGQMLPYLAPDPDIKDATIYFATLETTEFKGEDNKEALMLNKIVHLEDFGKKK